MRAQSLGERSNGGTGGITPQDIASACAGMTDAQYLLLLRLYTQDKSVQQKLFYQIYDYAVGLATRDRWRVPVGQELVRKMTALALAEVIEPRACPQCNGKGEVWLRSMPIPSLCEACDGGGRKPPTVREKAEALGLEESNFAKRWRCKYEQIFDYVSQLNADGLRLLKKRLQVSDYERI